MKFTVQIDDEKFDALQDVAKLRHTTVPVLVQDNIGLLFKLNPKDHQVLLEGSHLAAISQTVDGKTLKTPEDVVDLFKSAFQASIAGTTVQLTSEDLQYLKTTHASYSHLTFPEFIEANIKEALAMYLYGSSVGLL